MSSQTDTKTLIETAITRFIEEVPALAPLQMIVGLELPAHGDTQIYRIELRGATAPPLVTKDIAPDAKLTLTVTRSSFNQLATKGHVSDWRNAFEHGDAKATGVEQHLLLVKKVVEMQEERSRARRPRSHA
jgi:hypothetical protein